MGIVDIEYEVYHCPCCTGYILMRLQYPHGEMGCSPSLEHYAELPGWLEKEALSDKIEKLEKY